LTYTREEVERLLPCVWDAQVRQYGLSAEFVADADMPKRRADKSKGSALPAMLVDIEVGWRKTDLTIKERQAVFLRFAFDMKEAEIALIQGDEPRTTINSRLFRAVGKIAASMNGTTWKEELDDEYSVGSDWGDGVQPHLQPEEARWDERDVA